MKTCMNCGRSYWPWDIHVDCYDLMPFNAFVGPGTGLTLMARTDPVMREWQARDPRPGTIERNFLGQTEKIY